MYTKHSVQDVTLLLLHFKRLDEPAPLVPILNLLLAPRLPVIEVYSTAAAATATERVYTLHTFEFQRQIKRRKQHPKRAERDRKDPFDALYGVHIHSAFDQ